MLQNYFCMQYFAKCGRGTRLHPYLGLCSDTQYDVVIRLLGTLSQYWNVQCKLFEKSVYSEHLPCVNLGILGGKPSRDPIPLAPRTRDMDSDRGTSTVELAGEFIRQRHTN
jgi:hypothetical protein